MSHRRELEEHRHKLGEIREIMNSMKTLAYMETRKLSRVLAAQQAVVEGIEAVAADFVSFYPETLPTAETEINVYLLMGSERGFCGNFNESLLPAMEASSGSNNTTVKMITLGHKLHTQFENDPRLYAALDGASVVEEVEAVLNNIVDTLVSVQTTHPTLSLYVLYHGSTHDQGDSIEDHQVMMQKLLPPFLGYVGRKPSFSHAPLLNVSADNFLLELTDHYLFAALHEILYTSLMAENRRRVQHLEGAVQHMDDKAEQLRSQCNALRQEEIIEEIEVILLSAASLQAEQDGTRNHR